MRHKKSGRHLNRTRSHYISMIKNMCNSLIKYNKIKTTLQKAKELQQFIEKLINRSKIYSLHNKKLIYSFLRDKTSITKLFNIIGKKNFNRKGGFTKIIKYYKFRHGDNANLVYIMLV